MRAQKTAPLVKQRSEAKAAHATISELVARMEATASATRRAKMFRPRLRLTNTKCSSASIGKACSVGPDHSPSGLAGRCSPSCARAIGAAAVIVTSVNTYFLLSFDKGLLDPMAKEGGGAAAAAGRAHGVDALELMAPAAPPLAQDLRFEPLPGAPLGRVPTPALLAATPPGAQRPLLGAALWPQVEALAGGAAPTVTGRLLLREVPELLTLLGAPAALAREVRRELAGLGPPQPAATAAGDAAATATAHASPSHPALPPVRDSSPSSSGSSTPRNPFDLPVPLGPPAACGPAGPELGVVPASTGLSQDTARLGLQDVDADMGAAAPADEERQASAGDAGLSRPMADLRLDRPAGDAGPRKRSLPTARQLRRHPAVGEGAAGCPAPLMSPPGLPGPPGARDASVAASMAAGLGAAPAAAGQSRAPAAGASTPRRAPGDGSDMAIQEEVLVGLRAAAAAPSGGGGCRTEAVPVQGLPASGDGYVGPGPAAAGPAHHTARGHGPPVRSRFRREDPPAAAGTAAGLRRPSSSSRPSSKRAVHDVAAGASGLRGQHAPPGASGPNAAESAGGAPGAAGLVVSDELFATYIEECMLTDFAAAAAGPGVVALAPRSRITNWPALDAALRALGYRSDCPDAWSVLGVAPARPAHDPASGVARRLELARTLLSLADEAAWRADDLAQAAAAQHRFEEAADAILREVAVGGGRQGQVPVDRRLCQELGAGGVSLLLSLSAPGGVLATQCSDHLGLPESLKRSVLPVAVASRLWLGMCSSQAAPHWEQVDGCEVTLWSPSAPDEVGRLLGGFVRHLGRGGHGTVLKLVCPLDELPGCLTPVAVLQHWGHSGLAERWAGVLAGVEFALEPVEQISPGARFPQAVWRPLGVLTFRHGAVLGLPAALSATGSAPPLVEVGVTIHVDFPTWSEPEVLRELGLVMGAGWHASEPRRSPASQQSGPRLRVSLYAGHGACLALDAAIFARTIHRRLRPWGGVAARGDILMDDTALLLAVTGPGAFPVVGGNCEELLPLGPRNAVLRTTLDEARWEEDMRAWQGADPGCAALHLRYKRLVQEGRMWASAPGTAARRRQAAMGGAGVSTRLVLQLRGPPGPRPDALVRTIGDMLQGALGRPVQAVNPEDALTSYALRPRRGVVMGAFTGVFEVAVGTQAEARHLHEVLHGRGVQLGQDLLALEVSLAPLAERPGNGRRC